MFTIRYHFFVHFGRLTIEILQYVHACTASGRDGAFADWQEGIRVLRARSSIQGKCKTASFHLIYHACMQQSAASIKMVPVSSKSCHPLSDGHTQVANNKKQLLEGDHPFVLALPEDDRSSSTSLSLLDASVGPDLHWTLSSINHVLRTV